VEKPSEGRYTKQMERMGTCKHLWKDTEEWRRLCHKDKPNLMEMTVDVDENVQMVIGTPLFLTI
jgi:muconolactone delta-isomerase